MSKYKIKFRGLKEGRHKYKFEIEDSFFEKFPESEIKKAKISGRVELLISKDLLTLNIELEGTAELQCDRCLDFFDSPIKYETVLYADFGDKNSDLSDADNKITITDKASEIVLDKHFYDYIHLSLPYQKIHPTDENGKSTCNTKMTKIIEKYSLKENNETVDPRWDKLKSLYN